MADLKISSVPIDSLQAYHRNPRRGNVKKIAESLQLRGQYRPIVVNLGTKTGVNNEILAGNHTWQAAKSLNWDTIQIVTVDVDADQAAQIVLADNKLSDIGDYDMKALADVLSSIEEPTLATGYEADEVAEILAAAQPEPDALTDPDDAPDTPVTPFTRGGDIWQLGQHILLVGSSTDKKMVKKAAAKIGQVECIWTDPPYGVAYQGGTKDKLTIQNDADPVQAAKITKEAFMAALEICKPGCPFYMAHADSARIGFQKLVEDCGMRWRQTLVWVKDAFVPGHSDYQQQCEPIANGTLPDSEKIEEKQLTHDTIAYGFTPGGEGRLGRGGKQWYGDNKQSTVFEFPKPRANKVHPTMKPVELIQAMLKNSCHAGGIVYDPFAGSGSTLIAAHGLRMKALVVELDPRYADVICRRFQEYTGTLPELNGKPHDFTTDTSDDN